jgi:hypothetical protein
MADATGTNRNGTNGHETQPRDDNGRYASRWIQEPANPYARRVALLRQALLEALTEEEAVAIFKKLIELAKEGSVAAAKLVFQYALGDPLPASHPDWVEHDEWRLRMARPGSDEMAVGTTQRPPWS